MWVWRLSCIFKDISVKRGGTAKQPEMFMLYTFAVIFGTTKISSVCGNTWCPWGTYGDECDKDCSEHCRISDRTNTVHCHVQRGSCSEGCTAGWYGDECNKACSKNCLQNVCNLHDGACTLGCIDDKYGNFCEGDEQAIKAKDNISTPWKILVIVFTTVIVGIIIMILIGVVYVRRRKNRAENQDLINDGAGEALLGGGAGEELLGVNSDDTWHTTQNHREQHKMPIVKIPLHDASTKGDLDSVKHIVSTGAVDVNIRGLYGLTPLMLAAQNGHYDVFKYLHSNGADLTLVDRDGDHILSMACVGNNMDMVKYVVSKEPNLINKGRNDGRTAFMWAAMHGKDTVLRYLWDKGAECSLVDTDGDNTLHYACHGGHIGIVNYVIDKATFNINTIDLRGRTALMIAATYGHKDVFDLLVGKDSDISHTDKEGNTILHAACSGGHVKMVEHVLSQEDIDINCKGQYGGTPLMFATFGGHKDVFDLLVRKKPDVSLVDNKGNNTLHVACIGGHVEMVKHILSQGLWDINSQGGDGMTSLMWAARWGHKAVFDLLVKENANASTVGSKGNNILHVACIGGHVEMVKHILSQDMVGNNCQGEDGRTPLMLAVLQGCRVMFDFLESKGADLSQVDHKGNNVLHLACEIGSMEILQHVVSQNSLDINAKNSQGETATTVAKRKHHMDLYEWLVSKRGHVVSKSYLQTLKRLSCTKVEV